MKETEALTAEETKKLASLKIKKYRDRLNLFIIEGEHLIEEAVNSEFSGFIEYILIRHDYSNNNFLNNIDGYRIVKTSTKNFEKISETTNPQGIAALINKPDSEFEIDSEIVVALDNINDPGNAGTILRTCYWFGVNQIIHGKNTVDIYNSKTLRASQGAVFHVSARETEALKSTLDELYSKGYEILITSLDGNDIESYSFGKNKKYVIVFGNEANGVSEPIMNEKKFTKISVKGYSDCESLNVGVSSGIILNHIRSNFAK
ncbi:MAG: RNA methyltransferase [Bacteroidetes bacterium]|nr:RNA methyltransferase [Bacteroidota bacterium]